MRFYLNENTGYLSHRQDDKELGKGFKVLELATDQKSLIKLFNEKGVFAPGGAPRGDAEGPIPVAYGEMEATTLPPPKPKAKLDPDAPAKERVLAEGGHWNYPDDACPMCSRTKGGARLLAAGADADEIGEAIGKVEHDWALDNIESAVKERRRELGVLTGESTSKPQPRARERIRVAPETNAG